MYSRELLVGTWFRTEDSEDGHVLTEFAKMSLDGYFEFSFIEHDNDGKTISESTECGEWGLVGDIHFTITKEEIVGEESFLADLCDGENYHAYRVQHLDNKNFQYQHIVTQEVFNLRRVVDKIAVC